MVNNKRISLLDDWTSEAEKNIQPTKTLNAGSSTINWANPESPSTIDATRREKYALETQGGEQHGSADLIIKSTPNTTEVPDISTPKSGIDINVKWNFDLYSPVDWKNQPEQLQAIYQKANQSLQSGRRTLSTYILQQEALGNVSSNINNVTTLIDAIENAYDNGVFDTDTIASQLGVDREAVSLVQQGKANELVKLDQDFVKENLAKYYRAEEDYNVNLQRAMEDYQLAMDNLNNQYNSAMQTAKRSLFDDRRAASVGSAVAGISGSEYAVRSIETKHQQNIDDLNNNYLYSSLSQQYNYTRAIEDYNTNIQRLSEDFDTALKDIQASVLQQFQEIDSKIGLTTAQIAQAYGTLEQNVLTAKATATTNYLEAIANNEDSLANAIANTYGIDTGDITTKRFTDSEVRTGDTIGNDINSIGHILASNDWLRIGTYKSSKWYTYNVYATREDWLKATVALLKRWYYGLTAEQAAQKWIGKWKDISDAKSVLQQKWIKLTDTLSDENVEKFIEAMWTWEWTLKGQTLEERLQWWRDIEWYTAWWTTTWGLGTAIDYKKEWWYKEDDAPNYELFLKKWNWWFKVSDQEKIIKEYGSWENFRNAAANYQKEKAKWVIDWFQEKLDTLYNFKDAWNNLTQEEREEFALIDFTEEWWKITYQLWKNMVLSQNQRRVIDLYKRIKWQAFITEIIESKNEWASYWQLSDKEWDKITSAAMDLNIQTYAYVNDSWNDMVSWLQSFVDALQNPDGWSMNLKEISSPTTPNIRSLSEMKLTSKPQSNNPEITVGTGRMTAEQQYQSPIPQNGQVWWNMPR